MQSKVKDAMNFKKRLGNNLGNNDDILLIYCDTLMTLGTIGYSSAGITVDENTLLHFSPPFGYKQAGDTVVVTDSAIGSMSDTSYKKKCIPDVTHTYLPNDAQTLDAIKNFLNL
jgi:hypothetical protein